MVQATDVSEYPTCPLWVLVSDPSQISISTVSAEASDDQDSHFAEVPRPPCRAIPSSVGTPDFAPGTVRCRVELEKNTF